MKTSIKYPVISYLLLSDLHLGHDKNKTEYIVRNLDLFFKRNLDTILKTRIIFIAGDVFDRLLSNSNKDSILAYSWLSRLLVFCKNNDIKLRILEGTPSHDRKQVKQLTEIIKSLGIEDEVDYRYFDKLDIEFMKDLGLSVLYIPDEWKENAEDTLKDVKKILITHGLDKVDIIIMHGAFKYQIPNIESPAFHNQEEYVKLVNYTVNCGHVHNPSVYEKILVPGSFDRLNHSDEKDTKGGLIVNLFENGTFDFKVLENKTAMIFKTFDLSKTDWNKIEKELKKLNNNELAFVRFLTTDEIKIKDNLFELKQLYPNLRFTVTKKDKVKNEINNMELTTDINIDIVKLDEEAIKNYIMENIPNDIDEKLLLEELNNIL